MAGLENLLVNALIGTKKSDMTTSPWITAGTIASKMQYPQQGAWKDALGQTHYPDYNKQMYFELGKALLGSAGIAYGQHRVEQDYEQRQSNLADIYTQYSDPQKRIEAAQADPLLKELTGTMAVSEKMRVADQRDKLSAKLSPYASVDAKGNIVPNPEGANFMLDIEGKKQRVGHQAEVAKAQAVEAVKRKMAGKPTVPLTINEEGVAIPKTSAADMAEEGAAAAPPTPSLTEYESSKIKDSQKFLAGQQIFKDYAEAKSLLPVLHKGLDTSNRAVDFMFAKAFANISDIGSMVGMSEQDAVGRIVVYLKRYGKEVVAHFREEGTLPPKVKQQMYNAAVMKVNGLEEQYTELSNTRLGVLRSNGLSDEKALLGLPLPMPTLTPKLSLSPGKSPTPQPPPFPSELQAELDALDAKRRKFLEKQS